jgi:hypothetical protein
MEDRGHERVLSLCGTILNRQKLLTCEDCGAVLGPARYIEFVRKRTKTVARAAGMRTLCDACLRHSTAKVTTDNFSRQPK